MIVRRQARGAAPRCRATARIMIVEGLADDALPFIIVIDSVADGPTAERIAQLTVAAAAPTERQLLHALDRTRLWSRSGRRLGPQESGKYGQQNAVIKAAGF